MQICKQFQQESQDDKPKGILTEEKILFETIENEYVQMSAFLDEMKDSQVIK